MQRPAPNAGERRAPAPPDDPLAAHGMEVSGFWATWERPLSECFAEHQRRRGGQCRRQFSVVVKKSQRRLIVRCEDDPVKGYFVALGGNPTGHKERRGDERTPEGEYNIWGKNPWSRYYLGLGVSYPNARDAEGGVTRGLIGAETQRDIVAAERERRKPPQGTRMGGDIFLHGGGIGAVVRRDGVKQVEVDDWTAGCVALRNSDMKELFDALPEGTPLRIEP